LTTIGLSDYGITTTGIIRGLVVVSDLTTTKRLLHKPFIACFLVVIGYMYMVKGLLPTS